MKKTKKYKQTIIPNVNEPVVEHLGKYVKSYYEKNIQGRSIINEHLGITISFTSIGKGKIAYGSKTLYAKKVAVVQCLPELLSVAKYNNFGVRKPDDKTNIVGFLNFKGKVKINGMIENVRLSVMLRTDGKFFYNHEVNIIPQKKKSTTTRDLTDRLS
ncbi:MAG: hypothetical protein LBH22_07165 [Bacteroidales bacterium]|jgi:hypothetical protein|nr:hypothetical protein [Bacteroidales bacterium]